MNVKRRVVFAAVAVAMLACGAQSGPAPVATISVKPDSIVSQSEQQVAFESDQVMTGPVTFIEFYAEW